MRQVVVFDTEFTTWEGAMQRRWSGPGELREIVQIGAVQIDAHSFDVLETFELLIKPVRNPCLSDYFISLTGITQEQVDTYGVGFSEGLTRFLSFAQGLPLWAYGADVDVLAENMGLYGVSIPPDWPTREQSNLAPWFHKQAPQTIGVNSGRLAQVLGAGAVHHEHTGLADSLSIVSAMKQLVVGQGASCPFKLI